MRAGPSAGGARKWRTSTTSSAKGSKPPKRYRRSASAASPATERRSPSSAAASWLVGSAATACSSSDSIRTPSPRSSARRAWRSRQRYGGARAVDRVPHGRDELSVLGGVVQVGRDEVHQAGDRRGPSARSASSSRSGSRSWLAAPEGVQPCPPRLALSVVEPLRLAMPRACRAVRRRSRRPRGPGPPAAAPAEDQPCLRILRSSRRTSQHEVAEPDSRCGSSSSASARASVIAVRTIGDERVRVLLVLVRIAREDGSLQSPPPPRE